jgi:hypothetical protein
MKYGRTAMQTIGLPNPHMDWIKLPIKAVSKKSVRDKASHTTSQVSIF